MLPCSVLISISCLLNLKIIEILQEISSPSTSYQVVSSPTPGNTSLFLDLVANIDGWFKIRMNLLWKWHLSLVKLQLVRNIEGSRLKLGLDHGNLVNISCDFD